MKLTRLTLGGLAIAASIILGIAYFDREIPNVPSGVPPASPSTAARVEIPTSATAPGPVAPIVLRDVCSEGAASSSKRTHLMPRLRQLGQELLVSRVFAQDSEPDP